MDTRSSGNSSSPQDVLQSQLDSLKPRWCPPGKDGIYQCISNDLRVFRKDALARHPKFHLTLPSKSKAVSTYRKDAPGPDDLGRKEFGDMPGAAKAPIEKALGNPLQTFDAPHQLLLNMNHCVGKPKGDCRTISETPILHRLFMRANADVREWRLQNSAPCEAAQVGCSASIR